MAIVEVPRDHDPDSEVGEQEMLLTAAAGSEHDVDLADAADREVVGFREFLATAEEVVDARHFVHGVLAERGVDGDLVAAADLVVEEFALNAVRQTGTFFSVLVELVPGSVRVAVRDDSDASPTLGAAARTSIAQLGRSIIASTTEQWGAESLGHGKEVWALLR
ncbi:MAG TPA: hypothetical protein VHB02_01935 [Acidimicrobiales bacterium]|nr:hypothetical protein [Acidimicrobiales bacterium]